MTPRPLSFATPLLVLACLTLLLTGGVPVTATADDLDDRVDRINDLLKDVPTVVVERRGDRVVATGWTTELKDPVVLTTTGWGGMHGIKKMTLSELRRRLGGTYLGWTSMP